MASGNQKMVSLSHTQSRNSWAMGSSGTQNRLKDALNAEGGTLSRRDFWPYEHAVLLQKL